MGLYKASCKDLLRLPQGREKEVKPVPQLLRFDSTAPCQTYSSGAKSISRWWYPAPSVSEGSCSTVAKALDLQENQLPSPYVLERCSVWS